MALSERLGHKEHKNYRRHQPGGRYDPGGHRQRYPVGDLAYDDRAARVPSVADQTPNADELSPRFRRRQVGPQGEFISTDQTMKYFKQEHWQPQLCSRETLEPWIARGEKTWGQKAVSKAVDILENYKPQKMPGDVQQSLNQIREKAFEKLKDAHIET